PRGVLAARRDRVEAPAARRRRGRPDEPSRFLGRHRVTAQPEPAVQLENLTRRFRVRAAGAGGNGTAAEASRVTAIDGVTLQIHRGELFGLLGPNGAGKTTTIRILCTLLAPTAGTARVWEFDVVRDPAQVRRHIGVVLTGERAVYWRLTGRENLEYFAALHRVPAVQARRLHRNEGKTIILTTHCMEEADQLCERVGIIDRGRIIALDTPQALKRAQQRRTALRLEVEGPAPRAAALLQALPGVGQVTVV